MMMNIKSCISRGVLVLSLAAASLLLTGCVNQHPEGTKATTQTETVESMLEITDPVEKQAVEVAKAGSITQAAENLYMAQPNLSKAIKELEETLVLGEPCLERMVLSAAKRTVLEAGT